MNHLLNKLKCLLPVLLPIFLSLVGYTIGYLSLTVAGGLFAVGLTIGIGFVLSPSFKACVESFLDKFNKIIASTLGKILLSCVFFCLISPLAIILKVLRKDPLKRKFDRSNATYWESPTKTGGFEKMF